MRSAYLAWETCERLYTRVREAADQRAMRDLRDCVVSDLKRKLTRRKPRLEAVRVANIAEEAFVKTALKFCRIATYGQALRYARRVAGSLYRDQARKPGITVLSLDAIPGGMPDPRADFACSATEGKDLLLAFLVSLGPSELEAALDMIRATAGVPALAHVPRPVGSCRTQERRRAAIRHLARKFLAKNE